MSEERRAFEYRSWKKPNNIERLLNSRLFVLPGRLLPRWIKCWAIYLLRAYIIKEYREFVTGLEERELECGSRMYGIVDKISFWKIYCDFRTNRCLTMEWHTRVKFSLERAWLSRHFATIPTAQPGLRLPRPRWFTPSFTLLYRGSETLSNDVRTIYAILSLIANVHFCNYLDELFCRISNRLHLDVPTGHGLHTENRISRSKPYNGSPLSLQINFFFEHHEGSPSSIMKRKIHFFLRRGKGNAH